MFIFCPIIREEERERERPRHLTTGFRYLLLFEGHYHHLTLFYDNKNISSTQIGGSYLADYNDDDETLF